MTKEQDAELQAKFREMDLYFETHCPVSGCDKRTSDGGSIYPRKCPEHERIYAEAFAVKE